MEEAVEGVGVTSRMTRMNSSGIIITVKIRVEVVKEGVLKEEVVEEKAEAIRITKMKRKIGINSLMIRVIRRRTNGQIKNRVIIRLVMAGEMTTTFSLIKTSRKNTSFRAKDGEKKIFRPQKIKGGNNFRIKDGVREEVKEEAT